MGSGMRAVGLMLLASLAACDSGPELPPGPQYGDPQYPSQIFADGQYVRVGFRLPVVDGEFVYDEPADGLIEVSKDGTNWQVTTLPRSGHLQDVAFGDGRWIVVGHETVSTSARQIVNVETAFTAPTGGVWVATDPPPVKFVRGIAYGAGRWVASGEDGLIQSVDTTTWTPIEGTETLWFAPGVDFVGGVFVAYGYGPALLDSADGLSWHSFDTQLHRVFSTEVAADGSVIAHGYNEYPILEDDFERTYYTLIRTGEGAWTVTED